MAMVSSLIGYTLLKVKYAGMINIIADRMVQPEFLQWRCTLEDVIASLEPLLLDKDARNAQIEALSAITDRLRHPDRLSSEVAAEAVLEYVQNAGIRLR